MRIDWLTVGAQIANFLILVWLLHRFLYGPITRAMAGRERRIADRIGEAERAREEAAQEAARLRRLQGELEERREAMMAEAREIAARTRSSLEEEARAAVEARRRDWLQQLEAQQNGFLRELRQAAAERFWALARRALHDLADEELEEKVALGFVRQLEVLGAEAAQELAGECARHEGGVVVRSRFPLSGNAKRQITRTLHERLGLEARVGYEHDRELAAGIELAVGGRLLRWSLSGYLDHLEAEIGERLVEAGAFTATRERG